MRPFPKRQPSRKHRQSALERAFLRLLVLDLIWPASTSRAIGQVDFIRLDDLTFVEPAKQEVPHGKSGLG